MDCASVPKGQEKKRRRLPDERDDRLNTALPTQPKRRFFDNDTTKEDPNRVSLPLSLSPQSASSLAPVERQPAIGSAVSSSSCRRAPPPSPSAAFDQTVFEAIVEQSIEPEVMQMIRDKCGNNIERAVNIFYDGTWKSALQRVHKTAAVPKAVLAAPTTLSALSTSSLRSSIPEQRYVGAFGVEGWTTRSGVNLLKHGDTVRIERQRAERPRIGGSMQKTTKLGAAAAAHSNAATSKRMDVIVRFTTTGGIELGRLSKQAASWVSALMDQKVCKFEGVCVYAPERLRTNDTVFLQLRCWLLRSAFDAKPDRPDDNRTTGLFEEKETAEERGLRLRQVALVRLFEEINLLPTRVNEAATKRGRQGLLEAAEMAEQRDSSKDVPKEVSSTATTSDEPEDGQELEQDQLDALYRKAQSFDFSTPEAEPPDTFALSLRPYQKQALHWMISKERDGETGETGETGENAQKKEKKVSMHPLWEEYLWPLQDVDGNDLPPVQGQPSFYVNPYSGDLSLDFPAQEQNCRGGILADEMGLGKTIQMLSLIHAHKSPVAMQLQGGKTAEKHSLRRMLTRLPDVADAPCTTLVVAPMSLLAQWQSEAERASTDGSLRSMVYYGHDKAANLKALCSTDAAATAPDVVITSYGTVLSEFTQMWSRDSNPGQGLFALNFFRIILDEGHTIKNRQSKTAKACYALTAEHRWVLTGTPVVNRLEDLFSLIRFLRVEPWDNFSFWRTFITVPFESKDFMRALDVVQTVLEPLVMRRTKDMKTPDGRPLVALPSKQLEIVNVELSATERDIYEHIFLRVKRSFTATVEAGTVMKSYTSIFAQVLRLRQCCCHPVLVRNMDIVADEIEAGAAADAAAGLADDMDLQALIERFTATTTDEIDDPASSNAFGAHVLGQIRDEAVNECPICAEEPMIDQTVTGCWHSACKDCLLRFIRHETDQHRLPRCFHCREVISRRDLFGVVRHDDDPATTGQPPRISLQRVDVGESSAKIVSLLRHLRDLRRERPTIKSVVFSQFTSFLSLIEPALRRDNMAFLRLDGTMAQKARAAVLEDFRRSDRFTVLLISLRAGGVGLNLTMAKRVFVMDPWWSFSVEAQAIDRVHRMGQDEEVKVYRFIVKGSVEEKMLKIQDRKKFIATSLGMMSDEEKKLQRIEDIKELLS